MGQRSCQPHEPVDAAVRPSQKRPDRPAPCPGASRPYNSSRGGWTQELGSGAQDPVGPLAPPTIAASPDVLPRQEALERLASRRTASLGSCISRQGISGAAAGSAIQALEHEPSRLRRLLSSGSQALRRRPSDHAARIRTRWQRGSERGSSTEPESPVSERAAWAVIDRMDSGRLRQVRGQTIRDGLWRPRLATHSICDFAGPARADRGAHGSTSSPRGRS